MKDFKKFLEDKIDEEVSIKGNPGIPGEGQKRPEDKDYLSDLERDAQQRLGVRTDPNWIRSPYLREISELIYQSRTIISGKESELEELAENVIKDNFSDILHGVKLDIKFVKNGLEVKDFMDQEDEDQQDLPKFRQITDPELIRKIHKAKLANNIIQGEAKNTKHLLHDEKVKDGIISIFGEEGENALEIWDQISKLADKLDWIIPVNDKSDMMENAPGGFAGAVKVDWVEESDEEESEEESEEEFTNRILNDLSKSDDVDDSDEEESEEESVTPVIRARGIDFPMLLHEAVKGIYELIAAVSQPGQDASPEEIKDAETVKLNVSSFDDEAEDFRNGPEIAADLRDFINESPESDYTSNMRAFVFGKMMDENYMSSEDFLKLFRGILNKTEEARRKIDSIVSEIVAELKKYELGEIIGHEEESDDEIDYDGLGINRPGEVDYDALGIDKPEEDDDDLENEEDYSKLSQREIQTLIDNALDDGDFSKVDRLKDFLKEGKEIYEKELRMIKENHNYHRK